MQFAGEKSWNRSSPEREQGRETPGKAEKENLRGKSPGIGAARKEGREEKTPGEQRKCNLRWKKKQAGIDRKEKEEMFLEKCKEMK